MITYCPRCGARFPEELRGELLESTRRCVDCAVLVTDPPLMLAKGNDEDEVDYDLGEWMVAERSAATAALSEVDIPFRWEQDLVLVVPAVAATQNGSRPRSRSSATARRTNLSSKRGSPST